MKRTLRSSGFLLAASLALVGACKHADQDKAAGGDHADLAVKVAKEAVPIIQGALPPAASEMDKMQAHSHCAAVDYKQLDPAEPALAKQLHQLCEHDVPLAQLRDGVTAAEAAHQTKPDDMLAACHGLDLDAAKDLTKYHTEDADSKALLDRLAAVCK